MKKSTSTGNAFLRLVVESSFIIMLFYANLLMGEFTRSGPGYSRGLAWAIWNILTLANFAIAAGVALIGHLLFEYLRKLY